MHGAEVKIITDSESYEGAHRLTTFQLRYWRPIHSELMTHRVFSRNAGSSRARPSLSIIKQVFNDPWGPLHWGENQPGMQAENQVSGIKRWIGEKLWRGAAKAAAIFAYMLLKLHFHKQLVNRILEPFTYIDVLVTSCQYANWFSLRNHKDAQPEIRDLAKKMLYAYDYYSIPVKLKPGEWHLPYINAEDWITAHEFLKKGRITRDEPSHEEKLNLLLKVSTARCARISYKLFDGNNSTLLDDFDLFKKLIISEPLHASPTEHQATPDTKSHTVIYKYIDGLGKPGNIVFEDLAWDSSHLHGNLPGWIQYRKTLANEFVEG